MGDPLSNTVGWLDDNRPGSTDGIPVCGMLGTLLGSLLGFVLMSSEGAWLATVEGTFE